MEGENASYEAIKRLLKVVYIAWAGMAWLGDRKIDLCHTPNVVTSIVTYEQSLNTLQRLSLISEEHFKSFFKSFNIILPGRNSYCGFHWQECLSFWSGVYPSSSKYFGLALKMLGSFQRTLAILKENIWLSITLPFFILYVVDVSKPYASW